MANTKKTGVSSEENVLNNINEEKKDSNDNKEVDLLKKQIEELKLMMLNMQSQNHPVTVPVNEENFYDIGIRLVYGAPIYSPRKEVVKEVPFDGYVTVDDYELNNLIKSNFVKEWLEKDILFFSDSNTYKKKRINKRYDLSDDAMCKLICDNSTIVVVGKLNEMTKNMKDDPMVHCLYYRIVELCDNGKLSKMPYETRQEIENMFGFRVDNAQALFRGFRNK